MKFFFDNCISSNLTAAMKLLNEGHHTIEHLTERCSEGVLDEEWLPLVSQERDLFIVSADPAITTSKKEREIWRRTGLTSFFFGGGFADKKIWTQTFEVVRWWPEVLIAARAATRGAGYLLEMKGRKPRLFYDPYNPSF